MSTTADHRMVALPQSKPAEESPLHLRRKKLSATSRPFPPGFIPVVQPPSLNRSEIQRGARGPIFLPADLRSPLPPSFVNHKQGSQAPPNSLTPFPTLPPLENSQPRFMPSIKRLYNNVLLGHRQPGRSDPHTPSSRPPIPMRSQTDQNLGYNRPMGHLRTTSTLDPPKRSNASLPKNPKQPFPMGTPPQNVNELVKRPSISSKVIKKAKSIGELRPQIRNRSTSLGSSHLYSSCRGEEPCPKVPEDLRSREILYKAISPKVSLTKWSPSGKAGFSYPTGRSECYKDKSKVSTVPAVNLGQFSRSQTSAHTKHQHAIDLPYYIELESIEVLERSHGSKSPSLENLLVSF